MKRDAVITSLLLANACLLVYVAILVWQKPSLYDIDARIEYWHNYYEVDRAKVAKSRHHDDQTPHDWGAFGYGFRGISRRRWERSGS